MDSTRRDFLLEMMSVAASSVTAGTNRELPEIRLAIAGCGGAGRETAGWLQRNAKKFLGRSVMIAALCDIFDGQIRMLNAGQREKIECACYRDYFEMIEKERGKLDGVFICTPDSFHCGQAVAALENGISVYCELPLAESAESARKIMAAAKRTGQRLFCPLDTLGTSPIRNYLAEKIVGESRLIGKLRYLLSHYTFRESGKDPVEKIEKRNALLLEKGRCDMETLHRYGYDSPHEWRQWRQYRKFGLGELLRMDYRLCLLYLFFIRDTPKALHLSGARSASGVPTQIPIIRQYMFGTEEDTLLVEQVLQRNEFFDLMLFGENGIVHIPSLERNIRVKWSPMGNKTQELIRAWDQAAVNGTLGPRVDKDWGDMCDEMSILEHSSNPDRQEIERLKQVFATYSGETDAWALPPKLLEERVDCYFADSPRKAFLEEVMGEPGKETAATLAFHAQVMVDAVEKASTGNGTFIFKPEMFAY